jgi:hypothetical protein
LTRIANVSTARLCDLTVAFGLVWGISSQLVFISDVIGFIKSIKTYKDGTNKKTHRIGGFQSMFVV